LIMLVCQITSVGWIIAFDALLKPNEKELRDFL
jgi:hypothetical protein